MEETKPVLEFTPEENMALARTRYYERNKDHILEVAKLRRAERKQKRLELLKGDRYFPDGRRIPLQDENILRTQRNYYERNRDEILAKQKEHYRLIKEGIIEKKKIEPGLQKKYNENYYKRHREEILERLRRIRAAKPKKVPKSPTPEELEKIEERIEQMELRGDNNYYRNRAQRIATSRQYYLTHKQEILNKCRQKRLERKAAMEGKQEEKTKKEEKEVEPKKEKKETKKKEKEVEVKKEEPKKEEPKKEEPKKEEPKKEELDLDDQHKAEVIAKLRARREKRNLCVMPPMLKLTNVSGN